MVKFILLLKYFPNVLFFKSNIFLSLIFLIFSNGELNGELKKFVFAVKSLLISSPFLIELQILDSTTGKFIKVSGCNNQNKIIMHMPFYSYRFLDEFNSQKLLYDPYIYKSPDDPIFSDPVYLEENGKIRDDTIEQ